MSQRSTWGVRLIMVGLPVAAVAAIAGDAVDDRYLVVAVAGLALALAGGCVGWPRQMAVTFGTIGLLLACLALTIGLFLLLVGVTGLGDYIEDASGGTVTLVVAPFVLVMIGAGTYLFYVLERLLRRRFTRHG